MKKFFKSFILTLLIVTILFFGSIAYFLIKSHVENPADFISEMQESQDSVSFYLLGVDSRDKGAENTRSDTIMLVNIDFVNSKINLISIPRDTYASIEGHGKQKINHSYNFGGAELTVQTLNNLLGKDIQNYMTMDYEFVESVVDIVGGVDVDVPIDMDYEDTWADPPLKIHLKAGPQTLNGSDSIGFLRFRKGYANQDLGRVEAQQQFVGSFLQKLKEPRTLLSAPALFSAYDKYTDSNLPFSTIVKIGLNLKNIDQESISTATLPGSAGYMKKISYFFMDENAKDDLFNQMNIK